MLENRIALVARSDQDAGYRSYQWDDPEQVTVFDGWLSNAHYLGKRYGVVDTSNHAGVVAAGSVGYALAGLHVLQVVVIEVVDEALRAEVDLERVDPGLDLLDLCAASEAAHANVLGSTYDVDDHLDPIVRSDRRPGLGIPQHLATVVK